jgi:hypothetical protein
MGDYDFAGARVKNNAGSAQVNWRKLGRWQRSQPEAAMSSSKDSIGHRSGCII